MGVKDWLGKHAVTILVYILVAVMTVGAAYLIFILQDGAPSAMPCIGRC